MDPKSPAGNLLTKIDFSGMDPAIPAGGRWAEVRAQVMAALETQGWFEAVYDRVGPELKAELFGRAMPEVFALPLEAKLRNASDKSYHGYLGQIPYLSYESLAVPHADRPIGVQSFSDLLWPRGNLTFCETVNTFAKHVAELDRMIQRMVFESLGLDKHYDAHMQTNNFLFRMSEYAAPDGEDKKLGLVPHRDTNTMSIVCQNQVDGLQMKTPDGEWIPVSPSPSSFVVMAGDALRTWSNGRIYSPMHQIVLEGSKTRYSGILFSLPEDDLPIQPFPELVNDEHPALFKPYIYGDYLRFCMSEDGLKKAKHQLDAYCGVAGPEPAA